MSQQRVSLWTLFVKFATIGAISFGGGIVAYLRRLLVEDQKWLTADEFLATLEISQMMPGLNSVNMSVLVGARLCGPLGSMVAALGMVLPGAIFVMAVGIVAIEAQRAFPIAHAAISGVAAGAVGLLGSVVIRTGYEKFKKPFDVAVIIAAFVAMIVLKWQLFEVLILFGIVGIVWYRPRTARHA